MKLAARAGPQDGSTPPVGLPNATRPTTRHFHDQPVRVARIDGKTWLCASDLCRALQLVIGGTVTSATYTRRLSASGAIGKDDRGFAHLPTPQGTQRLAVLSVRGALALAGARIRPIDHEVIAWLKSEFPDA